MNLYNLHKNYNDQSVNDNDVILLATKSYISRKLWLSCILVLELEACQSSFLNYVSEINNCLAFCFYELKLYQQAQEYYTKLIQVESSNISYLLYLVEIYKQQQQKDKAINLCQRILKIDKNNKKAQNFLNDFLNNSYRDSRT